MQKKRKHIATLPQVPFKCFVLLRLYTESVKISMGVLFRRVPAPSKIYLRFNVGSIHFNVLRL